MKNEKLWVATGGWVVVGGCGLMVVQNRAMC
jgi:hypothetical protein